MNLLYARTAECVNSYVSLLACIFSFLLLWVSRGGVTVARQAHNLKAVGSIPAPATKCETLCFVQGVLRLLSKELNRERVMGKHMFPQGGSLPAGRQGMKPLGFIIRESEL